MACGVLVVDIVAGEDCAARDLGAGACGGGDADERQGQLLIQVGIKRCAGEENVIGVGILGLGDKIVDGLCGVERRAAADTDYKVGCKGTSLTGDLDAGLDRGVILGAVVDGILDAELVEHLGHILEGVVAAAIEKLVGDDEGTLAELGKLLLVVLDRIFSEEHGGCDKMSE